MSRVRSWTAVAGWGAAAVLIVLAVVVVEALTHSGVGMWFGFACLVVILVMIGFRVVGRYGGPGGGGSGGCGPGGC